MDTKADRACADFRHIAAGTGNDRLFRLGWRLAGHGCDLADIEARLTDAARHARSSSDRTRDVPRIMADRRRRRDWS
jgi:hypothetical protein